MQLRPYSRLRALLMSDMQYARVACKCEIRLVPTYNNNDNRLFIESTRNSRSRQLQHGHLSCSSRSPFMSAESSHCGPTGVSG